MPAAVLEVLSASRCEKQLGREGFYSLVGVALVFFAAYQQALAVGIKESFSILLMGAGLGDRCLDVHPVVGQERTYCREHA